MTNTDSAEPRWCVRAGDRWVPTLSIEDSPLVGGVIHLAVAADVVDHAVDDAGLICVRLARGAPPMCGQVLQTMHAEEVTTLVVSPIGFLEREADAGKVGDDYLLLPDGPPIALGPCHRLLSTCKDGNHVRIELPTHVWLERLMPRFAVINTCACERECQPLAEPTPSPGICRRIQHHDSKTTFDLIRLRSAERVRVSIDMANVMPHRTVLIGHERERSPLMNQTD